MLSPPVVCEASDDPMDGSGDGSGEGSGDGEMLETEDAADADSCASAPSRNAPWWSAGLLAALLVLRRRR